MPYTVKDPPGWMKNLPEGAIKIGVEVFNATLAKDDDEDKARQAAWGAIKQKYEKDGETWRAKATEVDAEFQDFMRLAVSKGGEWEVTICQPGPTLNGWVLPEEVLRDAEGLFEDVDVNLYELPAGATHVPDQLFEAKNYLVKNKVGWIDKVRFVAGEGLKGVLHFLDSAKWIGANIQKAMDKGAKIYGLSYDAVVRAVEDKLDGKAVKRAVKFVRPDSVDIVSRPAAGGRFDRAIASIDFSHGGNGEMKKEDIWKAIEAKRPDLLKGKELAKVTDEELRSIMDAALEPPPVVKPPLVVDDSAVKALDEMKKLRCAMALDRALDKSELPEKAVARVRKSFADRVFEDEELTRAIADEKDYLASLTPPPVEPILDGRITGGLGTYEKCQMAVDKLFGLGKEDVETLARMERVDGKPFFEDRRSVQDLGDFDKIPRFTSIREMYQFLTGDFEVNGVFNRKRLPAELRSRMDVTSSTFTYILGNTLGRRLVKDYMGIDFHESLLISINKNVKDFRTQEAVQVGYFDDLAVVDPEAADYAEIGALTDEEATYTVVQYGNILTITRKTIINDDISLIARLIPRLAKAARRTHAQYVWNFWINNGTAADGTAWHAASTRSGEPDNLSTTALSHTLANTAYIALAKMIEKDSGKRIGFLQDDREKPVLIHPPDLIATVNEIVSQDHYFSTNDLTAKLGNPLFGRISGRMVSLLTDANDWGLILPASVVDHVEMGYLNGRQAPEMFVADAPQSEQVFVADKIRHKIRFEFGGAIVDHRGSFKAVVT